MTILLSDIWPIKELAGYKLHFGDGVATLALGSVGERQK